jgi:hypothetical protein
MTSASHEERPAATELWHLALYRLQELVNITVIHRPLDESKIIWLLQDLYAVGERPSYEEFKAYLAELWPLLPGTRRQVRELWRTILRNPHHHFRRVKDVPLRFTVLDWLVREHGLRSLDDRLHDVALGAFEDFYRTALANPDLEAWLAARRTLRAAIGALSELRRMRLGHRSTGDWFRVPPDAVSLEEMREWNELKRKYASRGGLYA